MQARYQTIVFIFFRFINLDLFPTFEEGKQKLTELWRIAPQEKQKFSQYFKVTDSDNDGFVTGVEAREIFG